MVAMALQNFKAGYDAGQQPSMYPAIRDYMGRQDEWKLGKRYQPLFKYS